MQTGEPEVLYLVARELVSRGLSVIPTGGGLSDKAKQPHFQALKLTGHHSTNAKGECKATWRAMQERLPSGDELHAWYLEHRAGGIGVVTGQLSGYVVVDVDVAGLPLLEHLGWRPHVHSPSGGCHLYLKHPGWYVPSNASQTKHDLPSGFDVRGDGGYIMFPPTRTRKGSYRRTDERRPLTIQDIPETLTWQGETYPLRAALGLSGPPEPEPEVAATRFARFISQEDERCPIWLILERAAEHAPTSRNKGAFFFGLWANANGYPLDEALHYVGEYLSLVAGVKPSPFPPEEAATAIRSGYRLPKKDPWQRREGPGSA
ncbi:bifunctional DNA primase/polymerase [Deinococcus sp.]|uniref:bifunctional DNA primase/polymerase n=1 Tax=Deinococcus sp. TaxID=47478 RepID=UPI003B5A8F32